MKQTFGIKQSVLEYAYTGSLERPKCHPELAEKRKKRLEGYPYYTNYEDALQAAHDIANKTHHDCQIWAKVGKDEDYYYVQDYFMVSNDNGILEAMEYLGMAQIEWISPK